MKRVGKTEADKLQVQIVRLAGYQVLVEQNAKTWGQVTNPTKQSLLMNKNTLDFIDWEHLHHLSDGDADFEMELLQMFAEDAQIHLVDIRSAIENSDYSQVSREAHYIKGASANVGAEILREKAEELEQQAHQNQIADAPKLLSELEAFLKRIQEFVNS